MAVASSSSFASFSSHSSQRQVPVHQASVKQPAEAQSKPSDVWTEADLPLQPPAEYRIAPEDYDKYRAFLLGRKVKPARFSQAQLEKKGYSSWKQYQLHASLGNF